MEEPSQNQVAIFQRKKENFNNDLPEVKSEESLRTLFNGFSICGMIMPKTNKILYIIYSIVTNFLCTLWLPLSFMLSFKRMSWDNLDMSSIFTAIQVGTNVTGCSIKTLVLFVYISQLRSAKTVMKKLDARCVSEDEINELRKLKKLGSQIVKLVFLAYFTYTTMQFVSYFIIGRAAYEVYIPYIFWKRSRKEYFIAFITEIILIDLACVHQVLNDCYPVVYISVLRTHIRILLIRIKKLTKDNNLTKEDNIKELKECIKDHKNLLELFDIISPVVSITSFVQLMITALLMGTTLINITIFTDKFSAQIACSAYLVAVVLEIFPLCYFSQRLSDDSDLLSQSIFHSTWVEEDIRFKKMLVFFIQHTQRAMELTAGKLIPVNLNSFLSIAKFSFSLYTFIQKMGLKERFSGD